MTYIIRYFRDEKVLDVKTRRKGGLEEAISRADEAIVKHYENRVVVLDGAGTELYQKQI